MDFRLPERVHQTKVDRSAATTHTVFPKRIGQHPQIFLVIGHFPRNARFWRTGTEDVQKSMEGECH